MSGPWSSTAKERAEAALAGVQRHYDTMEADPHERLAQADLRIADLERQLESARSWAIALEGRLGQVRDLHSWYQPGVCAECLFVWWPCDTRRLLDAPLNMPLPVGGEADMAGAADGDSA